MASASRWRWPFQLSRRHRSCRYRCWWRWPWSTRVRTSVWAGRWTVVLKKGLTLALGVSNGCTAAHWAYTLSSCRAKMLLTSPRPWKLAKASGMAAETEVTARRPASSCEGLIVRLRSSIQRGDVGRGPARRLKAAVRRCAVEPVVRRERVGVSTNSVDYASWSRDIDPFPTKNERLGKENAVEGERR